MHEARARYFRKNVRKNGNKELRTLLTTEYTEHAEKSTGTLKCRSSVCPAYLRLLY